MISVVSFSLSIISLCVSIVLLVFNHIFEHRKDLLGRTGASLRKTDYKKNVPVYGKNHPRGPLRVVMIIKHVSKSVYEYTVNGKKYKIRYTEYVRGREMPYMVTVIYLKRLPKIAYVDTDTNSHHFDIYAIVSFAFAVLFVVWGCRVVF